MHTRRILLAFSLAASAASVAFADYQTINQSTDSDRLEQLSKTLSQGSYTHPDDLDLPASAKVSVTLRQKRLSSTMNRSQKNMAIRVQRILLMPLLQMLTLG